MQTRCCVVVFSVPNKSYSNTSMDRTPVQVGIGNVASGPEQKRGFTDSELLTLSADKLSVPKSFRFSGPEQKRGFTDSELLTLSADKLSVPKSFRFKPPKELPSQSRW